MAGRRIFDGKPVLEFSTGIQRRSFLKYAGLVGVGTSFAIGGGLLTAPAAFGSSAAIDSSDLDMTYGLGAELDVFRNVGVRLEQEVLKVGDIDLDQTSASVYVMF